MPEPVDPTARGDRSARRQVLARLSARLGQLEASTRPVGGPAMPSGSAAYDRWLPGGGWLPGTLVEWLTHEAAEGAATLALTAARAICRGDGTLVVIDPRGEFYPPAAAALGIDLERTVIVRPSAEAERVWACDQALRSLAVAAVLAPFERLEERDGRRFQFAARASGAVGLLLRPAAVRTTASWAHLRLEVVPQPGGTARRWQLRQLAGRGSTKSTPLFLELDDETGTLRVVAPLAARATVGRSARA